MCLINIANNKSHSRKIQWRNKETILVTGKNALVDALYKNAPTVILVENSDNFSLQYYIETKKKCVWMLVKISFATTVSHCSFFKRAIFNVYFQFFFIIDEKIIVLGFVFWYFSVCGGYTHIINFAGPLAISRFRAIKTMIQVMCVGVTQKGNCHYCSTKGECVKLPKSIK